MALCRPGREGGGPPAFETEVYQRRNAVGRCRLKQWRGVATRYNKKPSDYLSRSYSPPWFLSTS